MTDASTAFTKKHAASLIAGGRVFHALSESSESSSNVSEESELARCHARERSQSGKGDARRGKTSSESTDGLWLVPWTLLIFLLPLVSISTPLLPWAFHAGSDAIRLFEKFWLGGPWRSPWRNQTYNSRNERSVWYVRGTGERDAHPKCFDCSVQTSGVIAHVSIEL